MYSHRHKAVWVGCLPSVRAIKHGVAALNIDGLRISRAAALEKSKGTVLPQGCRRERFEVVDGVVGGRGDIGDSDLHLQVPDEVIKLGRVERTGVVELKHEFPHRAGSCGDVAPRGIKGKDKRSGTVPRNDMPAVAAGSLE